MGDEVMAHLVELDGTEMAAVQLLTGLSAEEIAELGGLAIPGEGEVGD